MEIEASAAGDVVPASPKVEVRRSAKRRRSVQAYREADRIVVLVPASFSKAEEQKWVTEMVSRITRSEARRRRHVPAADTQLMTRARQLSDRYLDGKAVPVSVRWVSNQRGRWGSCTPSTQTIRLSDRIKEMPSWVVDYVLVHELAHLIEHGHGPRFWSLVAAYPQMDKAQGYLEGVHATAEIVAAWEAATTSDSDSQPAECVS